MKNTDAVVQYMNWAMIVALAEANPDCREVHVKYDLARRTASSQAVPKDAPEERDLIPELHRALEVVFVALTGPEQFNRQGCIEQLRKAIKLAESRGWRVPRTTSEATKS